MSEPTTPSAPDRGVRQVRRSRRDRILGGVCGGIGRYLGVDPVLLRVAAVALALSGGLGVLAYVIGWVAIPEAAEDETKRPVPPAGRAVVATAVGAALVFVGTVVFVRQWYPWFGADLFWPLIVVAIGLLVVFSGRRAR
jgi:phage shock protein C